MGHYTSLSVPLSVLLISGWRRLKNNRPAKVGSVEERGRLIRGFHRDNWNAALGRHEYLCERLPNDGHFEFHLTMTLGGVTVPPNSHFVEVETSVGSHRAT